MAKKQKNNEPQYYMSATNNKMLNYRVYKMNAGEKLLYALAVFAAGGIVGQIFYGGLFQDDNGPTFATNISNIIVFIVVGIIALKMFMPALSNMLKNRRIKQLRSQFRDFLDSLSNSLSSGMNMNDALMNSYSDLLGQYSDTSFIVLEVKEMINGIQNNIAIEDIIKDFGRRSGIEDVSNFATVFETSYRTGGNIKDIVRRTTDIISEKMMITEEINTKLTSNKMQMQIMNVIPIFLVLMMRSFSSDFSAAFSSVIGVIGMTVGVVFFLLSYRMGQKIMDIKG